jgi:class 3 adenylate cyclase
MNPESRLAEEHRRTIEEFRQRHRTNVLTLLVADIAGSSEINERLGDAAAVELSGRRQSAMRDLLRSFGEAAEIPAAGDLFFAVFVTPSNAVRFALQAQDSLRSPGDQPGDAVRPRIGIHMGRVHGGKREEEKSDADVLAAQVDVASRVMSVAEAGQILLTSGPFHSARISLRAQEVANLGPLSWLSYGLYSLEGVENPVEICEVGKEGVAPLKPPPKSDKAWEFFSREGGPVPGWRPAAGQQLPGTEWIVEEHLDRRGLGEFWRARHRETQETRIFRFFFKSDQVRFLRQEVSLLRAAMDMLGKQPSIARIYDVELQDTPAHLEEEDVPGLSLPGWIARQGGFDKVAQDQRREIVAQVADALAAIHSAGIVHGGVKATNVFVELRDDGLVRARLADVGLGQWTPPPALGAAGFAGIGGTARGTTSLEADDLAMAPEVKAGGRPTAQSDIYSLGVLLYQMLMGDFSEVVPNEWNHIGDASLRNDLRRCTASTPWKRTTAPAALARHLRSPDVRRVQYGLLRFAKIAAVALVVVIVGLSALFSAVRVSQQRSAARRYIPRPALPVAAPAVPYGAPVYYPAPVAVTPSPIPTGAESYAFQGHAGAVTSVAFSPEFARLATASGDRSVRIWDIQARRLLSTLWAHRDAVNCVAFDPDGKRLATASADKTAKVWEASTAQVRLTLNGHTETVVFVAFSPDGKRLATASHDKTAKIWDAQAGTEIRTLSGHAGQVSCVAFSPDGTYLATASWDTTAKVWELETGREIRTLKGHKGGLGSVAFSPDGKRLVTSSREGNAKVWELETGREVMSLEGHADGLKSATFSPDGKLIATASRDRTARLWDAATGRVVTTLTGHSGDVFSIAFSPDGKRLATASEDRTARLWDVEKLVAEELETAVCAGNLLKMHAALVRYRDKHYGKMPDSLTDLVPEYFSSGTLLCPRAPKRLSHFPQDARVQCSYAYLDAPPLAYPSRGMPSREISNTLKLLEYGDIVPTVRCSYHGRRVLSLSYAGNLYFSPALWENAVLEDRGTTITGSPCILLSRRLFRSNPASNITSSGLASVLPRMSGSKEELNALVREFWRVEGPDAEWEKLPEIARNIAGHPAADATFLNNMAWEIVDQRRRHPQAALLLAEAATRRSPNTGFILDTVAWAHLWSGNFAQAVRFFEAAVASPNLPQKGPSLAGLAIAFNRQRQVERAWETLRRAINARAARQYLLEAYLEASQAAPGDRSMSDSVKQYLGAAARPEVEFFPRQPHPGEKVNVYYRPWLPEHAVAARATVHWGINRWQYPGDEAARATGARQTFWAGTTRPSCLQQPMVREGDAWVATLTPAPTARQIDLTFFALIQSGEWTYRGRDFSIPLSPSGPAGDSATTATSAPATR